VVVGAATRPGESPRKFTTSSTIINHVLNTREGVLCANAMNDPRFARDDKAASLQSLGLRSVICVPILVRDEVRGIIHLDCLMSRHTYTHDQLRMAIAVGRMCGMAAENQRLAAERVQRERLAAVGETVAYLSHHIRNLLQGLRSGTDIVEMGLKRPDQAKIRSGWHIVQNNLDRIHHLTTNMLTFSKDRQPRIELTQINSVIEDAVSLAQRPADDRSIMLLTDLADDLPAVPADPDGVHQAVYNLILNAIAACPDDSGRVVVKSAFDAKKQAVRITVRDNGPGISEKFFPHLFQPFQSSKGQGGTGLGLAAAKKITDDMHGDISVQSKPDEGTKFIITLRLEGVEPADSEKTHGPPS